MAEVAFVFVDAVLSAVEAPRLLQLRVADKAAILVAVVLGAPETASVALRGATNETTLTGRTRCNRVNFDFTSACFSRFRACRWIVFLVAACGEDNDDGSQADDVAHFLDRIHSIVGICFCLVLLTGENFQGILCTQKISLSVGLTRLDSKKGFAGIQNFEK